ncbi:pantoate kinase [Brevundimonas bullata]|uniref:Pantoate kinase n=1 Tax=Brevundimonas bullata TaxID=13160 RepID=A0A7W7N201_9CAUL|nr:hypothetical protein [Brevundimonas bullata]MBB4796805.1 pantoate kinase [Brevundimonas bullata]MBB6381764.1 pantoate kinase [Brevundimonas bullata]
MLLIAFMAALAAQEVGVPATPAPPPAEVAPIRWTRSPGLEMPGKALQANVSGSATLRCDFAAGTPTNCVIVAEAPVGYGFGIEALRAMRTARAEATTNGHRTFSFAFETR